MDTANVSRQIRGALVAMLVLGIGLNFMKASLWLGPDGTHAADPDFKLLTSLTWAQMGISVLGWLVVVLRVRTLARASDNAGPLTVALWCWGVVLVLSLFWIAAPWLAQGEDLVEPIRWLARTDAVLLTTGAVASIIHARNSGASATISTVASVGVFLHVVLVVSAEFEGVLRFEWFWSFYILSAVRQICLMGSLAMLPWAPDGDPEVDHRSDGQARNTGSAATDLIVGALFLGGGIAITYVSWTGGGIGGRTVLAWGPIVYGLYRLIRGLTRSGQQDPPP